MRNLLAKLRGKGTSLKMYRGKDVVAHHGQPFERDLLREDPRYPSTTDGKDLSVSNHRVRPGLRIVIGAF